MDSPAPSTVLLLDLSLPRTTQLMSPTLTLTNQQQLLMHSGDLSCTLQPSQQPNLLKMSLKFWSPIPQSLGMRMAQAWHHEQLLQACLRMDQRNAECRKVGMIPTTLTMSQICDHAQEDVDHATTVMGIHHHHNPNDLQHQYPFLQGHYLYSTPHNLSSTHVENLPCSLQTWRLFTSCVKMP